MGNLGIIFAIILLAWVYAALHPRNIDTSNTTETQVITVVLVICALFFGILGSI